MSVTVNCPGCRKELRVRDEYAGKKFKCPDCAAIVEVPVQVSEVEEDIIEAAPAPRRASRVDYEEYEERPRRGRACPECGELIARDARRCEACGAVLKGKRKGEKYVPCPLCGAPDPKPVTWTIWGSFYGPALMSHVRCRDCRYAYNGRTGGSNVLAAVLFVTIPLLLIIGIIIGVVILLIKRNQP